MRLFNRYSFENLAIFIAAIIGTFLMWGFALYASVRVDVPQLDYYGRATGYTDTSMMWGIWTFLSSTVTFIAVCALIIVVAVEAIDVISSLVQRRIDARMVKRRQRQTTGQYGRVPR